MTGGIPRNIDNVVPKKKAPTKPVLNVSKEKPKAEATPGFENNPVLISWTAPNFEYSKKNVWWYVGAGLFMAAIIGYFVWTKDWFPVAITVILSIVLFWYVTKVRPSEETYAITDFGIELGKRYVPFTEIHSFSIHYSEDVKKVYFIFLKKYLPSLAVDISSLDPAELRFILTKKIPESQLGGETVIDSLARFLHI